MWPNTHQVQAENLVVGWCAGWWLYAGWWLVGLQAAGFVCKHRQAQALVVACRASGSGFGQDVDAGKDVDVDHD